MIRSDLHGTPQIMGLGMPHGTQMCVIRYTMSSRFFATCVRNLQKIQNLSTKNVPVATIQDYQWPDNNFGR